MIILSHSRMEYRRHRIAKGKADELEYDMTTNVVFHVHLEMSVSVMWMHKKLAFHGHLQISVSVMWMDKIFLF
jgi:hypothetical protein